LLSAPLTYNDDSYCQVLTGYSDPRTGSPAPSSVTPTTNIGTPSAPPKATHKPPGGPVWGRAAPSADAPPPRTHRTTTDPAASTTTATASTAKTEPIP